MSDPRPFAHLHCHTHFSLLDGANRIPDLVKKTKEQGMSALAITDHGNLFGAVDFYSACKANDINPILGLEAYIAPGDRRNKKAAGMKEASTHLTLLAMNRGGFQNLIKLSSIGYREGFYYKPRIDKESLEAHSEGLICLSGCASSELSRYLLADKMDEAESLVDWYAKVFGDRFYMEIQNAGIEIQKLCADGTIDLANRKGLPLVATNDAHYLNREDAPAHDVLLCVNTRSLRSDEKRMRMTGDEFFVRTPEEMYAAFPDQMAAVARTQEIADRVDIDLDLSTPHYPVFTPPDKKTDTEYLRELCEKALVGRYGDDVGDLHHERLDYELKTIEQMGYSSYFLIVWDFVIFAESEGIPCQARGSACGSIVAYLLAFSNVCPLEYDLLFERFLDPSRAEPPDIDIDFCRDGRQKVIDYTKEKYGEENVAQIGTFGTMKAKAAIRDVGRALGVMLPRVDELAKMIPDTLGITLAESLKESPELKEAYDQDPQITELIDIAMRLEGLARSAGTHAAGLVIADEPLSNYVPLQHISGKTDVITQWDGPTVEKVGLLKMDFLGLRNLTILDKAVKNVKQHRGVDINPITLPLDDADTFALLQRGETKGIFQLESGGMRDLLTKMKPDTFLDIIATSALYRPGPLEGGMVMTYVNVKNGREPIPKVHPIVDEILEETYGVMVYQEQVMRILNRVGGIELPAAYRCIKAISKKKLETIAQFREQYVTGAKEQGLDEKVAINLFELIEKFAGYGFNKSHSTAYGAIAYQTAYLKAHYPEEFMAALLSCGMESSERISEHVDDSRRMGIEVIPPDVNQSDVEFSVVGPRQIAFGMGAIKGVGEQAVGAVAEERKENGPFKDIFDLTERVDTKSLNRSMLETLIKAGALDSLGPNRAQHSASAERAVNSAAALHRDKLRGQKSLFGGDDDDSSTSNEPPPTLPEAPDWTRKERLAAEREVFGFYLTSHPLTEHAARMQRHATHTTSQLADAEDKDEVLLAGMISSIKKASTKKPSRNGHTRYVNFDLEDTEGVVRCIMWPEEFSRQGEKVIADTICFAKGKVYRRGREPNLIVDKLLSIDEAEAEFTNLVAIKFQRGLHDESSMIRVRDILQRFPGGTEVRVVLDTPDEAKPGRQLRYVMSTPNTLRVRCTTELQAELRGVLGEEHLRFHASPKQNNLRRPASQPMGV